MEEQPTLDLDFSVRPMHPDEIDARGHLRRQQLQRAVLAWMGEQAVAGMATQVPTRLTRFRAHVAGFWTETVRNPHVDGPRRLLVPRQTVIVELRQRRKECWPDATNSSSLLPRYRELKEQRLKLEAGIREHEPELRRTDTLFPEFSDWDYERSRDPVYMETLRELKRVARALYKGTSFEAIRAASLADLLYLAVPAKAVHPYELADGWGLLWVTRDLKVHVAAKAEDQRCQPDNRLHLVQNVAQAASQAVLFANGIRAQAGGKFRFGPVPRRRRTVSG